MAARLLLAVDHPYREELDALMQSWGPGPAPGPQARHQLTLQRAAALNEQGLVDRLVRDAHRVIVGGFDQQPLRDLFRALRVRPSPVLPPAVAQSVGAENPVTSCDLQILVDETAEAISS